MKATKNKNGPCPKKSTHKVKKTYGTYETVKGSNYSVGFNPVPSKEPIGHVKTGGTEYPIFNYSFGSNTLADSIPHYHLLSAVIKEVEKSLIETLGIPKEYVGAKYYYAYEKNTHVFKAWLGDIEVKAQFTDYLMPETKSSQKAFLKETTRSLVAKLLEEVRKDLCV